MIYTDFVGPKVVGNQEIVTKKAKYFFKFNLALFLSLNK